MMPLMMMLIIPGDEDLSTALHHASTGEQGQISPGHARAGGRQPTDKERVSLKSSIDSTSSTAHVSEPLHVPR